MNDLLLSEELLIHPRIDLLKLLAECPCDPYQLNKELGIKYLLYTHLKTLEKFGLITGSLKYRLTEKGRQAGIIKCMKHDYCCFCYRYHNQQGTCQ